MHVIAENMPAPEWRTIDGLRIRYVANEFEMGPHILLLSPWPESMFAFSATWDAFAAIGKVVAIDLPGTGHSDGRADLMAPEPMGEFLKLVLETFQLRDAHVVGPDIGTQASLFAASNHPGLFASAIIGSGTIDHTKIGNGLNLLVNSSSIDAIKDITGSDFVEIVSKTLTNYSVPQKIYDDFLESYLGPRFLQSVAFLRAFPQALPILRQRLRSINLPCLIIAGRNDPFVLLPNAEILHKELPRNRFEILETGHITWEDGAEDYARLATEWITGGYRTV
jgi:pimeloyl-ACP methyl ester carboxylesterase